LTFSEYDYTKDGKKVTIRVIGHRMDIVINHKVIDRDWYSDHWFKEVTTGYEKDGWELDRIIGEDLPDVIWCGR